MAYSEDDEKDEGPRETTRPDEGPMDKTELQSLVGGILDECIEFTDDQLSPDRARATDYYLAKPFGNEEEGRSQIVMSEVRDGVQAVLPSMLRVFFGPERVVELVPRTAAGVELAEQGSDYLQYVFMEENEGFLKAHSVIKDGLIRKLGIFKWGWEKEERKAYSLTGVTQEQLEQLMLDSANKITKVTENSTIPAPPQPAAPGQPPAPPQSEPTYDVELTHVEKDGCAKVWELPPEEFIFTREARTAGTALCVAHRTRKTRGELIAMGVDEEDLDEHGNDDSTLQDNIEEVARKEAATSGSGRDPEAGDANDKILYIEAYMRLDVDGDGVAELRKICTIGPGYHIVGKDPVDEAPFAVFCPDPEPHTLVGQSWADRLMDLQLIQSSLIRAVSDSAAGSIFSRIAYTEGQVNVGDLMNNGIGNHIRVRNGAVPSQVMQEIKMEFLGQQMLPFVEYFNDVNERRTGQNKGAAGLDADALQSSTKGAVTAAVQSTQERKELLCRIFAEGCLKPLFRGIYKLLVKYQPRKKMIKLRGKWVEIDPSAWDSDMEMTVNVALGNALDETKIAILQGIADKQEAVLANYGPSNPMVSVKQYRDTLAEMVILGGYKDATRFFNEVDPNWQPPQTPPPPSPEMMLAQLEAQKAQTQAAQKDRELQQAQMKMEMEMAFKQKEADRQYALEQEKIQTQLVLGLKEMELKYSTQLNEAALEAEVEKAREAGRIQSENLRESARIEAENARTALQAHLDTRGQDLEHARESAKIASDAAVKTAAVTEQSKAAAKPEKPAKPPVINIHNHIPGRGKVKVNRDAQGNLDSFEDDGGEAGS